MSVLLVAYRRVLDCDASLRHLGAHGLLRAPSSHWCFLGELSERELMERLKEASQVMWVAPRLGRDEPWDQATGSLLNKKVWAKTIILAARIHDGWAPTDVVVARWKEAVAAERVSVEGEADRDRLERWVGNADIFEVGPLSCWGEYPRLKREDHPRDVFVPPPFPQSLVHPKEMELLRRWRRERPTLFLAQEPVDFHWEPDVGAETLYAPRFPQHHGIALASAERVLSGRNETVYASIGQGVPAVRLQVAEAPGFRGDSPVPELALYGNTRVEHDVEILQSLFANYPWEAVKDWLRIHRRERDRFLRKHRVRAYSRKTSLGVKMNFCSVADSNYAPSVLGFVENAKIVHPKATFHLLALDEGAKRLFKEQWSSGVRVHGLEDLWSEDELAVIRSRSKGYQAFSSKARLLLKALADGIPTFYCDADIHFFTSAHDLTRQFTKDSSVFLFPHFNDVFEAARSDGLFNAGFVAVAPGAERFLNWWSDMCLKACGNDRAAGVVGDQGYLDFAPVFFPEVKVHREGNHNVARWNQTTLALSLAPVPGAVPCVRDGIPVGAYHAAFPDAVRVSEAKATWDQLVTFFTSTRDMAACLPLWKTVVQSQVNYWTALGRAVRLKRWHRGPNSIPTAAELNRWVRGWRRRCLGWMAGRLRRDKPSSGAVSAYSWWSAAQQVVWVSPSVKSVKSSRKRKAA